MQEFSPSVRWVRFGVFEVDLRAGEPRKKGVKIRLQGQPYMLLVTLLKEHGEVVAREQLRKALWPEDTFVDFDHSLGTAINKLREVLGDSASNPRFVETLHRRGYRFIAPVAAVGESEDAKVVIEDPPVDQAPVVGEPIEATDSEPARPAPAKPPRLKILAIILVVLSAGIAAWMLLSRPASASIRSLAVLPLENLSGEASQDYFSDGMTDELTTELGQISELRVISRTSGMPYKGAHSSLPKIGQDLNVDAVVEGAVLRSGSRVRITVQLLRASADKHLWAQSYEVDLSDVIALQKKV